MEMLNIINNINIRIRNILVNIGEMNNIISGGLIEAATTYIRRRSKNNDHHAGFPAICNNFHTL